MKIQKTIGAGVLSLGLLVGLGGYDVGATNRSIGNTGPYSYNKIKTEIRNKVRVHNDNTLKVENDNWQRANTGDAKVLYNTTGGDAYTGAATNENSLNVSATVDNTGAAPTWSTALVAVAVVAHRSKRPALTLITSSSTKRVQRLTFTMTTTSRLIMTTTKKQPLAMLR